MNKVRIISDEEELIKAGKSVRIGKTRCFVNNVEIPMVISADFHASVDEVPEFKFKVVGRPDIETFGMVTFDCSPENLSEACLIVSEELQKHKDFYKAFVVSVQTALKEIPANVEIWTNELAEKIVRRIAGEE